LPCGQQTARMLCQTFVWLSVMIFKIGTTYREK
jgi:hypothetical protein